MNAPARNVTAGLVALGLMLLVGLPGERHAPAVGLVDRVFVVPDALVVRVGEMLPEGIAPAGAPDDVLLELVEPARILLVKLGGSARETLHHALGVFTLEPAPLAIGERQLVLPDTAAACGAPLGAASHVRDSRGDVRVLPAGTRLGAFLVLGGAGSELVRTWHAATAPVPATTPALHEPTGDHLGVRTTLAALEPDGRPRAVLVEVVDAWGALGTPGARVPVVGFETDADGDRNDVLVAVLADPPGALRAVGGAYDPAADGDGDGVRDAHDAFPHDRARAAWRGGGWTTLLVDDGAPAIGDGDYDDVVLAIDTATVADAQGRTTDAFFSAVVRAAAHGPPRALGLLWTGLPDAPVTIEIERREGGPRDGVTSRHATPLGGALLLDDLLALVGPLGDPDGAVLGATGAPAVAVRVRLSEPAAADVRAHARLVVGGAHVRLPGEPVAPVPPASSLADNGFPWMLAVPRLLDPPRAGGHLALAYPAFVDWAASHGVDSLDWAARPDPEHVRALAPLVVPHWTIGIAGRVSHNR